MHEVKITTITVRNESINRYEYDRESTLKVSEEHFTPEETRTIVSPFIGLAISKGLAIDTTTSLKEIGEDEEEDYKMKYEAAQKTISANYTERVEKDKEIETLKTTVDALKSVCPSSHTTELSVADKVIAIMTDEDLSAEEKQEKLLEVTDSLKS